MKSTLSKALERYLEALTITQGPLAGEPLKLMPWQRRLLRLFDKPDDFALTMARGGAKTTTLAGVACAALDGPLAQERGEVVIAASSFSQAKIDFEHVRAFMREKIEAHPRDWCILDTSQLASIEYRPTGARVRCIGSDPKRAHGLAPVLVLADEPAQWDENKSTAMVAALRTAMGKIPGSRFVALGTRPSSADHWFSAMLDDETSIVYAAEPDAPPFSVSTWRKANPSLRYMPHLLTAYRADAKRAERDPQAMASFKALRLNLGVPDTFEAVLLDAAIYAEVETNDCQPEGGYILGLDVATGSAQSAAVCFYPASGYADGFVVFPETPGLAERGLHDGAGDLYLRLAERGELLIAGNRIADVGFLLREALERWGVPAAIVSDRHRYREVCDVLESVNFPMTAYVQRGMGFIDGSEDVRRFRGAILDGKVHPRKSLLLRNAMAGARVVSDPAGNVKLAKSGEGTRRQRFRDDAAAALILAVAQGMRQAAATTPADGGLRLTLVS